jgi:hypothetical protein
MVDTLLIAISLAVLGLPLLVPAFFVGTRIVRGELRVRFSLRGLLLLVTMVAVSCGILRLPLALPVKLGMLWSFSMFAVGLLTARLPAWPGGRK